MAGDAGLTCTADSRAIASRSRGSRPWCPQTAGARREVRVSSEMAWKTTIVVEAEHMQNPFTDAGTQIDELHPGCERLNARLGRDHNLLVGSTCHLA
jgi:hypothetical protein